jgi:two-component system NtrC family sensor kinase
MPEAGKIFYRRFSPYLVTVLIVVAALPLALKGGSLWGLAALVLAAFSFLTTRSLLKRMALAENPKPILDEQLLQTQKLASIGELSAGIAHEINNPLAIIRQEAEWLQRLLKDEKFKDPKEVQDFRGPLKEIVHQVDRCTEITQNLLNFARKREPVIQAADLNKIIQDMTALVEREARHNNIQIIRQFQPDLPQALSDPPLLRQVILNLLTNATYAIQKEGTITISTGLLDPEHLKIAVRDTGGGIPPENLGKIFDPFFTTKPEGKGTGLGLSICHGIIYKLGGQISVASQVGQGTTFTIILPLRPDKGGK